MVIIDQSKAYMTGSANDKCERSQQGDSIIPPLLSQHESPAQHPTVLRGMENTESSPFTTVSFFSSCLCERVRVRPRALAFTRHSCSISSGFSPYYPLKWAQNRIWAAIMLETHCVDSRHFSCKTLKSNLQQQESSRQISLAMKTARVRTGCLFPSFLNEISRSKFRMCCGTNVRSLVCHLLFNK